MDDNFATAMRRSLALTRAGNLDEATREIRAALGVRPQAGPKLSTPGSRHRARLGETLKRFKGRKPKNRTMPDLPAGARFERRSFAGSQGGRDYRLYVPAGAATELRGLIVMLHGCTQTPEDFAIGTCMNTQAEAHNMLIVWPEQPRAHNANLCWNWFEPGHQGGDLGETAIISGLAQSIGAEFDLQPGTTFAAGLSAGGAMAALLGTQRPDVFRAVGVHSGLPPKSANDMMSAFAAMRGDAAQTGQPLPCPAIVFHGTADPTVAPVNAARLVGSLAQERRVTKAVGGRDVEQATGQTADGHQLELWLIQGAGHTWSGGSPAGSHTDAKGPDASAEMMRFFKSAMES